jgi:quercetin dioxygenase-like cupin family protein
MCQTSTLDYAIIMTGEFMLVLDVGEEKTVKAGDYIVTSGVNH